MTLCIAWKHENKIRFTSDSRVSINKDNYSDVGIKVMDIPVKIYHPRDENNRLEIAYDHMLGMCYAGDTITAHLIKETINDILRRLQINPLEGEYSLRGICNVIEKFAANTAFELKKGIGLESSIEFLIGGFCHKENDILVYKLELLNCDDHYEVMVDRVLEDEEEIITLGSGSESADQIIENNDLTQADNLFKVLRQVSLDKNEPGVGGYLQYGEFGSDNNFKIFGVVDYKIENGILERIYAYRGTGLYKEEFETGCTALHIAQTFISPFEDEIQDYLSKI